MSSRNRRAASGTGAKEANGTEETERRVLEAIREATGAADEDIRQTLAECGNDVNEATSRLVDSEWPSLGWLPCIPALRACPGRPAEPCVRRSLQSGLGKEEEEGPGEALARCPALPASWALCRR